MAQRDAEGKARAPSLETDSMPMREQTRTHACIYHMPRTMYRVPYTVNHMQIVTYNITLGP